MASRETSIDALLEKARVQVDAIRDKYVASLHAKKVDPALRIDIKNAFENLRSALDYLAADIREQYCPRATGRSFYFPILPDQAAFDRKLDQWFPGLRKAAPALVAELEALQPYHTGQEWLGHFNRVNNENKHGDLVEQTRVEFKETTVARESSSVSWRADSVTFGPGVSILGAPIDPKTQLPVSGSPVEVKRVVWVDFRFADIAVSALALLRQAVSGIAAIVAKIQFMRESSRPTSA